jgi:hypothetical protein
MVTLLKRLALAARRWWTFSRLRFWLRPSRNSPDLRYLGPSTYDEVIYDAKTDTYYGLLYPKEMREANAGKPVVIHVVGDDAAAPGAAAGIVREPTPADGAPSPVAERPQTSPPA